MVCALLHWQRISIHLIIDLADLLHYYCCFIIIIIITLQYIIL